MQESTYSELTEKYRITSCLSKGSAEYRVYTAVTVDDPDPLILKELDEKRAEIYDRLCGAENSHVAQVYAVYRITDRDGLYISVNECAGRTDEKGRPMTLTELVNRNGVLEEKQALQIALSICDGAAFLHRMGIIHKDLKPDNIMAEQEAGGGFRVRIIDFGISEYAQRVNGTTVVRTSLEEAGTRGYNPHDRIVTPRWDVYSIGCILNYMLTRHTPDMDLYGGSFPVRRIIMRCTDEFSLRYAGMKQLSRELSHEAGVLLWDRIPVLRSIPGYRTHTPWKSLLATACYLILIYLGADIIIHRGVDKVFTLFILTWVIGPIQILFDPLYLTWRIKSLRILHRNTRLYTVIQAVGLFLCFVLSIILYYI